MKVSESPIDWESIPCVDRDNLKSQITILESSWPNIETLLHETKTLAIVSLFFPNAIDHEETRWTNVTNTRDILEVSPDDGTWLFNRALSSLYCGIPVYAFSDCMKLMELKENRKIRDNNKPSQYEVDLILVLATMMMNTLQDINLFLPSIIDRIRSDAARHRPSKDDVDDEDDGDEEEEPFTSLTEGQMDDILNYFSEVIEWQRHNGDEDEDYEDQYLIILLEIYGQAKEIGILMDILDEDKHFLLLMKLLFQLHCNQLLDEDISVNESTEQSPEELGICVPMANRSGSDRHPDTVLSILEAKGKSEGGIGSVKIEVDSAKGGFKMAANRDIAMNEIFFSETSLAKWTTADDHDCPHCWKNLSDHHSQANACSCDECLKVYCSERCKDDDFQTFHRLVCHTDWPVFIKQLVWDDEEASETMIHGVMALKLMLQVECHGVGVEQSSLLDALKILYRPTDIANRHADHIMVQDSSMSHIHSTEEPQVMYIEQHVMQNLMEVYSAFKTNCPTLLVQYSFMDFITMYGLVLANAIGGWFTESDGTDVYRSTIHTMASFANHSCAANAMIVHMRSELHHVHFQALCHIQAGEEVTVNYMPDIAKQRVEDRRAELLEHHGFVCICHRCRNEEEEKKKKAEKNSV